MPGSYPPIHTTASTSQGFVKHSIPLNLNTRDISLPVFTHPDALEVRWQAYRITTAILHLGPNRQQGHYRAAAFLPGQSRLWYSDDNQAAVEMSHIPAQVSELGAMFGPTPKPGSLPYRTPSGVAQDPVPLMSTEPDLSVSSECASLLISCLNA